MTRRAPAQWRPIRSYFLILAGLLTASCGARLTKLPTGPGEPAPDMAAATVQATAACSAVDSMTAEISASGSVGGRRLRARLLAGFTTSSFRLEAVAPAGPPLFILVANGADATLLLPRDEQVLEHGESDAVLEAIAGVRLGPSELLQTLTSCAMPGRSTTAFAIGEWRVAVGAHGAKRYLHRDSPSAPWHVATLLYPGEGERWSWRADYGDFHQGLPSSIHLVSAEPRRFDLELALTQVEPGAVLDSDVFRVEVPRSARRITLEDLRRSGPLGQHADGR